MRQPSDEGIVGWWRENRRKDDGGRHDDDEECGDEQAAEVSLDRRNYAAHGVENSKARRSETSGLGPRLRVGSEAACQGPAPSAFRLRTYSLTSETRVAWLQVSGETETGARVYGSSCSDSTPLGSAAPATHSRMSRALARSSSERAWLTSHCPYHMVQMNHGLPGPLPMAWLTW